MRVTLKARGSDGRVAIWTGDDDAPFDNPLSHLSRVKFHSSFDYPRVIHERTVNVTFPARTRRNSLGVIVSDRLITTQTYPLFSHGRPGQPWIIASFNISGQRVAATGSVPVQGTTTNGNPRPWARWVCVGADSANVYAYEYTALQHIATTGACEAEMPAITIPITVWVTDEILDGTQPDPDPALAKTTIHIRPDRAIFDGGKFDSNNRYLRTGSNIIPASTLVAGASLVVSVPPPSTTQIAWRYRCGSYHRVGPSYSGGQPPDLSNTATPFTL